MTYNFPREIDSYKIEVNDVCYAEIVNQMTSKAKPEIILLRGLLKCMNYLLYENYLTGDQSNYLILSFFLLPFCYIYFKSSLYLIYFLFSTPLLIKTYGCSSAPHIPFLHSFLLVSLSLSFFFFFFSSSLFFPLVLVLVFIFVFHFYF